MGKVAQQTKALSLFGTVNVDEADIRWKVNTLIRGGLTDIQISFFLRNVWSKACREKSAEVIVANEPIGLRRTEPNN